MGFPLLCHLLVESEGAAADVHCWQVLVQVQTFRGR